MDKKLSTQELFNKIQDRIVLYLQGNEQRCPICKRLGLVYKQNGDKGSVETCSNCFNGKVYECKYCGKLNKTNYCDCKQAEKERKIKQDKINNEKEQQLFNKAKKIKFEDYDGYFILDEGA